MLMNPFRQWYRYRNGFNELATVGDITAAYRFFLRRKPDAPGFATYKQMVANGLTLNRLISIFVNSEEYRQKFSAEQQKFNLIAAQITAVDLGGYSVCINPMEPDLGENIFTTRVYEPHVCLALRKLVKPGQTFVDIGANVGCISLLVAQLVGPTGRVLAVEPLATNIQMLYAGIMLNQVTNVRVLPYAAADQAGVVSLINGTSNMAVIPARKPTELYVYAQTIRLDDELAGLDALDFVKMDIEGYEPRALRGFATLIKRFKPTLITEFSPSLLRTFGRVQPLEYLEQLCAFYTHLHVITPFGDSIHFTDAEAVMAYWSKRDVEIARAGILPAGALHFDIIATDTALENF